MTRFSSIIVLFLLTTSLQAQGLPMTDQLGGEGVYGLESGGGRYVSRSSATPRSSYIPNNGFASSNIYRPPRTVNRGGFTPQPTGFTPQHAQQIANAVQQLGPAFQQARQNLQQLRQQNGGYLLPRRNRQSFGNRYTDGDWTGAQWAANSLRRNGYQNVNIQPQPQNGWRQRQGLQPLFGVFHNGRR